jgi:hypothetical protein
MWIEKLSNVNITTQGIVPPTMQFLNFAREYSYIFVSSAHGNVDGSRL